MCFAHNRRESRKWLTQMNLFVYSAVCSQQYWQTAKAVSSNNASWKDKTVFKPIESYFNLDQPAIDQRAAWQML